MNSKISCISSSFKKEINILRYIAKKVTDSSIFAKLLLKNYEICLLLTLFCTKILLETKNLNERSTTKTVLKIVNELKQAV